MLCKLNSFIVNFHSYFCIFYFIFAYILVNIISFIQILFRQMIVLFAPIIPLFHLFVVAVIPRWQLYLPISHFYRRLVISMYMSVRAIFVGSPAPFPQTGITFVIKQILKAET